MPEMKRAVSVDQLLKKKFIDIPITGKLVKLLGPAPARSGSWFIYGDSGHGKTTLILDICKELATIPKIKIAYDTLEEGARKSFQLAIRENGMEHCRKGAFIILDKEPVPNLRQRLSKHKSPNITVIDSVQYAMLDKITYKKLLEDFPTKLFICNSHAQGKRPIGAVARDIMFDSDVKIFVEGYCAFPEKNRMNRGKRPSPYIIWDKGAREYWGDLQIDEWNKYDDY